jgi:transglutaminase-like putative cysteine protease
LFQRKFALKRRKFLTAAALSLFGASALAVPAKQGVKPPLKPVGKPGVKPLPKKPVGKNTPAAPIQRSPLNTADRTVIDAPPQGSSASRLPPVKAPELPELWQDFEVTTSVVVRATSRNPQRILFPLPLNQNTLYQRNLGYECKSNADAIRVYRQPDGEQEILSCQWLPGDEAKITLISRISIAERNFDVTRRSLPPEREDILRRYLRETSSIPNEGEIYDLAMRVVGRIKDPVAQAKTIFEWVTENTAYLPDLPGGGTGDVQQQVRTGRFGGGSVDISALFVGLCRSMGIPARLVFGLRVDRSLISDSLSANPDDLRRDQHCRAEFYIPGYSWIPVDPSDVCRANSQGNIKGRELVALRRVMFGTWEMNWMAYSLMSDFTVPGTRTTLPFLNRPLLIRPGEEVSHISSGNPAVSLITVKSQRTLTLL